MVFILCGVSLVIWLTSTQASKEIAGFSARFTGDFERDSIYAELLPSSTRPVNAGVVNTRKPSGSRKPTTTEGVPAGISQPYRSITSKSEETVRVARVVGDHEDKHSTAEEAETTIKFYEDTTQIDKDNPRDHTEKVKMGRVAETPEQASTAKAGSSSTVVNSTQLVQISTTDISTLDWRAVHSDFTGNSPPSIRKPISQERDVIMERNEKNISRWCEADGSPIPRYTWYRDGQPIDNMDPHVKAYDSGQLFFPEFSKREDGLYHCTATNMLGTSVSVKVPIIFERPPGDANLNIPGKYDVKEGDAVNMPCADTPPTVPETFKRWYNVNGTAQVQMDARVGTDAQGVLRFSFVIPSDAKSYICALAPEVAVGRDIIRLYNTANLTVQPASLKDTRPRLVYASPRVKATIGGKAVLECFFSGFPVATVTWKNTSYQEVKDDNDRFSIRFGRRLTISKVREEDAGTYICTGNNGVGQEDGKIELNVTGPPQKIPYEGLDRLIKAEMDKAVLLCKTRAINKQHLDNPVWYRNGQLLTTGNLPFPERYRFSGDHTELHIVNLSKQHDTACYQCNVSNSEGYVFYDGYLQVIDAINITRRPPYTIIVSSNGSYDISVYATYDACCGLDKRWFFNGTILTDNDLGQLPFKKDGDRLLFDASSVDNSTLMAWLGHYSYRLSNNYQEVRVEFILSLESPVAAEQQPAVAAAAMNLWWIGLLIGVLVAIIVVIVVIVLVKSNYPRNTYPLGKAEIKHNLDPEQDLLNQSFQEF